MLLDAVFSESSHDRERAVVTSRQVLRCSSSECGITWERDANAAINMWLLATPMSSNDANVARS